MAHEEEEGRGIIRTENQVTEEVEDLTQEELGAACAINYKHLGAIERGDENPSLFILEKLAEGLGVEIVELFRFHHEEAEPTKLKKTITSIVNDIRDDDVEKLQLALKILNVLR